MTITMFSIDTLTFSKDLEKAGMKREVAEVLAEKIKDTQEESLKNVATKADILMLRQEIKISMLTTIISISAVVALIEKLLG